MDIKELLQNDLPKALPEYERRPQQEEMAVEVHKALREGEHLLVEAGTGVGKSLGYLIPAVLWSLENDERVVVATHTKNLQDQLLKKDIPVLRKLLAEKELAFSAVVVKGRSNYVCLRRLEVHKGTLGLDEKGVKQQTFLDDEMEEEKEQTLGLLKELEGPHDGQRDNFKTPVYRIWSQVCGEKDACLKGRCPWRQKCYINSIRIAASEANIILVNHALFFSDLAIRTGSEKTVLPTYGRVIIDEAHHIEDTACDNMAINVDYYRIKNFLLALTAGNGEVPLMIRSDEGYYEKFKEFNTKVDSALQKLSKEVDNFLGKEKTLRYKEAFFQNTEIIDVLERVMSTISTDNFARSLNLTDEGEAELETYVNRGMTLLQELKFLLDVKNPHTYVYWAEKPYGENGFVLKAAPVVVGSILKESLFSKVPAVLTSATLNTGGDFKYIANRIGIDSYRSKILDSPFNYKENCLLLVPQKALSPKHKQYYEYVVQMSKEILKVTRGNAFLLFTSYKAMNFCYDLLEDWLYNQGCTPFIQTPDIPSNIILEDFKEAPNPVLFGTNSFWEGVDVPGEKLSCVIVTKLPFSVPTRPIEEARVEVLQKNGINDFLQYSVPRACIRLKQGFGRLIRASTDRGVVAILDSRILTTGYGKYFLNSLPESARNRSLGALKRLFAS